MAYLDGISCLIVSYKSVDTIGDCIDSLLKQKGIEFEVIVVDNDSSDGTIEYLDNYDIKSIFLDKNRGFGAAVNLGAREARFKYLFILNPDTVIPQDTLAEMFRFAESESDLGLLAPALEYPDGRLQLSARSLPGRKDLLIGRGSPLYKLGLTGEKEAGYIIPEGSEPVRIPAVSATAAFIPTELFIDLGGFDERFFMYMEDIDLCRRIRDKGLSIVLLPRISVSHSWRKSSSKKPFFTAYHHHLSVLKYFVKYDRNRFIMNFVLAFALAAGYIFTATAIILRKVTGR